MVLNGYPVFEQPALALVGRRVRGRSRFFRLEGVGLSEAQSNACVGYVGPLGVTVVSSERRTGIGGTRLVGGFGHLAAIRRISLFGLAHTVRLRHGSGIVCLP
jgi:hypothetical protein